ncbi:hypothetical protein IR146_12215 [Actinomyces bowdenii]|uniref:Uncharacterized protein n=2 Tax=Actinomyces bowdenii TaxID=131109 RepID=A0A853ELY7_9ACTO|nr:hypothetical protein [Actinomyces bowdenii]NYS70259.1 hypothetical protein [Actinomyces bowdenii]
MSPADTALSPLPPAPLWGFVLGRFIMTVMQGVVLAIALLLWVLLSGQPFGFTRLVLVLCAAGVAALVRELVDGFITRGVAVRLNAVSVPPWCAVALGLVSPVPAGLIAVLILGGGRGTVLVTCLTLWAFIAALERPWKDKTPDAQTRAIDAEARAMTREYFAEDVERLSQQVRERRQERREKGGSPR